MIADELSTVRWRRGTSGPGSGSMSSLVVVELAGSVAGAHSAKLFGDLGARGVCIEPDGGAPFTHGRL